MRRFDLHTSYLHSARKPFIVFGILYLLAFTELARRATDLTTLLVVTMFFLAILFLGTYYRYDLYFRNSTLTIDDSQINWHRNNEDHFYDLANISGVRLPHQLARYYGMSSLQLRFTNGPSFHLDLNVPGYDDIIKELLERMNHYPHLRRFVDEIESEHS